MTLGRINHRVKSGDEPLHRSGAPLGATVLDFWRWGVSDLVSNATRGLLAEFIVANALGIDTSHVRDEWAAWDLTTPEGVKVEVKSAAYLQSWHQERHSSIQFSIKESQAWDPNTGKSSLLSVRLSDVYVFALLAHTDKTNLDPLNVNQWEFRVLPAAVMTERLAKQKTITLSSLNRICGNAVAYSQLREAVARTATRRAF
jgi:hypothetical protein